MDRENGWSGQVKVMQEELAVVVRAKDMETEGLAQRIRSLLEVIEAEKHKEDAMNNLGQEVRLLREQVEEARAEDCCARTHKHEQEFSREYGWSSEVKVLQEELAVVVRNRDMEIEGLAQKISELEKRPQTAASCTPEAWIERTPFPSFNGEQESWPELKRVFQGLMKASGQGEVVKLAQLKIKLPAEAERISIGVTNPKEAWTILEEWYGDRDIAIVSAMHKLESLRLPHAHEKVEALVTAVRTAMTFLTALALNAEACTNNRPFQTVESEKLTRKFY